MKIEIQSINFSADGGLVDFANKKIKKLTLLDDGIINTDVFMKIEKPESISALESYDSVKAAYDKTVEEKNNLEKEIMDYEQHTLESNEREKSAKVERNEATQRRKELDREVKLMEKNK